MNAHVYRFYGRVAVSLHGGETRKLARALNACSRAISNCKCPVQNQRMGVRA